MVLGQSFDGGALFAIESPDDYTAKLLEYDATTLQLLATRTFNEEPSVVLLRPPRK
jgi:hypothetical protein